MGGPGHAGLRPWDVRGGPAVGSTEAGGGRIQTITGTIMGQGERRGGGRAGASFFAKGVPPPLPRAAPPKVTVAG